MTTKLDKNEVKSPDQVKKGLEIVMQWLQKNIAVVGAVFLVFIVSGLAWSVWGYMSAQKELKLQSEVALAEKDYFEKKNKFKEAARQAELKKQTPPVKDNKKSEEKDETAATGDLQKDYGSLVETFSGIVDKNPNSKAASMSALYLAEIYTEYKMPEKAMQALEKVSARKTKDVLAALVLNKKAGLMADQGECSKAVDVWQNLSGQKQLNYIHDEAKLRMALCYEKMNETSKAEQLYTELSSKMSDDPEMDRSVAEDAKKYLRLLKIRQSEGT